MHFKLKRSNEEMTYTWNLKSISFFQANDLVCREQRLWHMLIARLTATMVINVSGVYIDWNHGQRFYLKFNMHNVHSVHVFCHSHIHICMGSTKLLTFTFDNRTKSSQRLNPLLMQFSHKPISFWPFTPFTLFTSFFFRWLFYLLPSFYFYLKMFLMAEQSDWHLFVVIVSHKILTM